MNAANAVTHFAAYRNADHAALTVDLMAFELDGCEKELFLKDMYQIADEHIKANGYSLPMGALINRIAYYANN